MNFPKDEFNKEKEASYKQLAGCKSETEFAFIANKFTNRIKDGHTGLKIEGTEIQDYTYPFRCKYLMDSLVIMAVSDQLPFSLCGERIKSINGISIKEIEKRASELYATENYVALQKSIMYKINSTEYLKFIGIIHSDKENLKILTYSGKEFEALPNFNGILKSQIPAQNPNFKPFITEPQQSKAFLYQIDNKRKLCYIQFNKMIDKRIAEKHIDLLPFWKRLSVKTIRFFGGGGGFPDEYFEDLLNRCLDDIEKNHIRKIAVDLRWNNGGSMTLGNFCFMHLACDKYNGYSSEIKKSELYNMQMETMDIDINKFNNADTTNGFSYTNQGRCRKDY